LLGSSRSHRINVEHLYLQGINRLSARSRLLATTFWHVTTCLTPQSPLPTLGFPLQPVEVARFGELGIGMSELQFEHPTPPPPSSPKRCAPWRCNGTDPFVRAAVTDKVIIARYFSHMRLPTEPGCWLWTGRDLRERSRPIPDRHQLPPDRSRPAGTANIRRHRPPVRIRAHLQRRRAPGRADRLGIAGTTLSAKTRHAGGTRTAAPTARTTPADATKYAEPSRPPRSTQPRTSGPRCRPVHQQYELEADTTALTSLV